MTEYKVVDAEQLDAELTNLANKIREKGGTTEELDFYEGDFTNAVSAIDTSKDEQSKIIDITENGTITVVPDEGVVWNEVTVNTAIKSGGGGNELITMTTATTTADKAYELFKALTDDEHCYCFVYKSSDTYEKNRQCLTFVIAKKGGESTGIWVRNNSNGTVYSYPNLSATYDLIVNVGDVYEKVVLW